MCEIGATAPGGPPTRREVLGLAAGVTAGLAASVALGGTTRAEALPTVEVVPGLHIHPRFAWAHGLAAAAEHAAETVKFLLVHHTATPNGRDPRTAIREAHAWHTGREKGWSDVAYHFFVGHDGSIWEGRAGSIDGPVVADATGGNQGFAQLVCLIGSFQRSAPTPAAQQSLVRLLAWLRWRYRLPSGPGATVEYVSRGSNRHPVGTPVVTPVISAHRDASATSCPGDAAAALLPAWRQAVSVTPAPAFSRTTPFRQAQRGRRFEVR